MDTFSLTPRPPFRLVPTVRALQRQPANRVDILEEGRYRRVLVVDDTHRLVTVEDAGSLDQPVLQVTVGGDPLTSTQMDGIHRTLGDMLGIQVDLTPFYRVAGQDPRLQAVATALRGLKPPRFASLFESILNSVLFQQISLAAGVTIVSRLAERYGPALVVDGRCYVGPPEPEAIAGARTEELRSLGLSGRKADVLRHLAGLILSGALSFEALRPRPSEEIVETLDRLPGIGRWTAEVILLRGFGRLDVFPSSDVGARRGVARLLGLDRPLTPAEEAPLLAQFGEQRGYLYFLSLGWRLLQTGLIEPAA